MHDICPNSMSMERTKESRNVPQAVPKGLNTSSAAATLREPPKTNQMTPERKDSRSRREIGSNLLRRMTRAKFASSLDTRNPLPDDASIPRPLDFIRRVESGKFHLRDLFVLLEAGTRATGPEENARKRSL